MSEAVSILKKSLAGIKDSIIRIGQEAKALEDQLQLKIAEGELLIKRKEDLEKSIEKLEKQDESASKSKKTK